MERLRRLYDKYPRRAAFSEILVILAVLVIHRWVLNFWYWGIYRLDLPLPESLSDFFRAVWLQKGVIGAILIFCLIVGILFSNIIIRRYTFRQVGLRFDTIWSSGRDCLAVVIVVLGLALAAALSFPGRFSFDRYFDYNDFIGDMSFGLLSGIFQQFILQGVLLIRALQIFERRRAAVLTASVVFSLLHAPNTGLMIGTLLFGALCSVLFLRNRNIFALGMLHGVVQQLLRVFLASFMVPGATYYNSGHYDYSLRVGPRRGNPAYLADLDYRQGPVAIGQSGAISIPVQVTNRSITTWDSADQNSPVFIGYHLLDAKGAVVAYDNVRTSFEKPLGPDQMEIVNLTVGPLPDGRSSRVEVDILRQEPSGIVIWFKHRGSKTLLIPLSSP